MTKAPHRQSRSKRGNMLSMTVLCIFLLLGACIVAFAFYMMLTEHQRGTGVTEHVALLGTKDMNESDRLGQLNNLLAMNRELVYWSRLVSNASINGRDLNFSEPLTQMLLDEARNSNVELERTRVAQIDIQKKSIRYLIDDYNVKTAIAAHFRLPWWQSYEPQVFEVAAGYIDHTASNVLYNDYWADLLEEDTRNKYIQPKSNLYNGNINAKLPSPDNDLDYKMAALAAPVEQTTSPARLVNNEMFKHLGTIIENGKTTGTIIPQVPTALKVVTKMQVASSDNKGEVKIAATATCNGAAQPPPPRDDFSIFSSGDDKKTWGNGGSNNNNNNNR